jgi:hypothetical protein
VAALRTKWGPDTVPFPVLKAALRETAIVTGSGKEWESRFGSGILDAAAAA